MAEPVGTCYEDAWRFLIKEEEGELVHGTVESLGQRIGHAWVELPTGYIWEPESDRFIKKADFQAMAKPQEEARYSVTEAAIMLARVGKHGPWTEQERQMLKRGNPNRAVPEGSIQTEIASLESEIKKKGRIISLIQSEAKKEGLTDTQYLVRLQDIVEDLAIPKTRVSTLGFEELEIPVANAVEALVVGGECTISSGFHGALNKRWTIVLDGKVSEKLEKAAREAGLEVKSREAPKRTGHYFTDVSLPDIGRADVETAKKAFDKFAKNYTGRPIVPTLEATGGNPMPEIDDLLPMSITEGPPLPKALGLKWPWKGK